MTGAVRVLPQCPTNSANIFFFLSLAPFRPLLMSISASAMLIRLFHVILYFLRFLVGIYACGKAMANFLWVSP